MNVNLEQVCTDGEVPVMPRPQDEETLPGGINIGVAVRNANLSYDGPGFLIALLRRVFTTTAKKTLYQAPAAKLATVVEAEDNIDRIITVLTGHCKFIETDHYGIWSGYYKGSFFKLYINDFIAQSTAEMRIKAVEDGKIRPTLALICGNPKHLKELERILTLHRLTFTPEDLSTTILGLEYLRSLIGRPENQL